MEHHHKGNIVLWLAIIQCVFLSSLFGVTVNRDEQADASRWVTSEFAGIIEPAPLESYLTPQGNRGGFERNGRNGGLLRINNTDYARGLYLGNTRGVIVHLASPAKSFEAVVGLDGSYDGCGYSNGSQQFSVIAGKKKLFHSGAVKVASPGVPIRVNLDGATEFTLQDGQDPQQTWCQEAIWADALVTLQNGDTLWLGDLPIGPPEPPYTTAPPFSFTYSGEPSSKLLPTWHKSRSVRVLELNRTEYTTTFRDPNTGLVVKWTGIQYHDFPVVEWTVSFENTGSSDTPIIENIQALDTCLKRSAGTEFTLHHFRGSPASATDYEPFQTVLSPRDNLRIATSGGRPSDAAMPYFNIDMVSQGVIVALGWPGQWATDFTRDSDRLLHVRAGQELTHFKLLPGEEVRVPTVALLFWRGDWIRAQNIWRKWMLVHNVPRPPGDNIVPKLAGSSALWTDEMTRANETNQKIFLARYHQEHIKLDYWWMDAGWYINDGSWSNTGTWQIDPKRFPNGLRPISNYAHSMGIQTVVWFEMERVTRGSWLWEKHPEWLLSTPVEEHRGQRLLNLGNPEARKWIVDYLNSFITRQAIDVYRIDFNIAPLSFWRNNDAPDRQGITEIQYVTGFLEYLDELKRLHPNLIIDTCASGGRRNDLDTLRRALPMHRSDYTYEPVGQQNITYGMSFWIPYYGAPNVARDNYVFRSAWSPQINLGWDLRDDNLDYNWMRRSLNQWHSVAKDFFGDYYPLLPYDAGDSAWMAWQFNRADLGEGVIQAFRRSNSALNTAQLRLRGLEPNTQYLITNIDTHSSQIISGVLLMKNGFSVSTTDRPTALVFMYRRAKK